MSDVNATLPEVNITATRLADPTPATTQTLITAAPFAAVSASVEVYMFEGSAYTIDPGQIYEMTVEKTLRDGAVGNATIRLAPGGPHGPESTPTWTEIVTPMSHVIIGMTRGNRAAIVLDGVSVRAIQSQEWQTTDQAATAGRVQTLSCADFAWFFRSFNWYALTFFGLTAGAATGEAMGFAPAGIPAELDQGLLGGGNPNPAVVAQKWFTEIMAGQGGILGKTFVPYQTNARISFENMISTLWENYPQVKIPYMDVFMASEQSWMDKFLAILPFPYYEFFVTTAPAGTYPLVQGSTGTTMSGSTFSMASQPLAQAAGPQLVARVNPTPALMFTGAGPSQAPTIGNLDMTRWNALPLSVPDAGFYHSEIDFDAEGACNFYILNPTSYSALFGNNNANNIPFYFSFGGAADPASIHRYGFRPLISSFRWLFDAQGLAAQGSEVDLVQSVATLMGRYISWFHPQPLMARAVATFPLMPDVMIGTRFRYPPFKDGLPWDFYVEGVRHHFIFGGLSTTTLTLTRGLPESVYADASSDGILQGVFTGNAMRQNGIYTTGLPQGTAPALTTFGPPDSITTLMGRLANIFVMPQAPGS